MIDETTIPRHYPHFGAASRPGVDENPSDIVDKIRFNCSVTYREDILKRTLDRMEAIVTKFQSSALEGGARPLEPSLTEFFTSS